MGYKTQIKKKPTASRIRRISPVWIFLLVNTSSKIKIMARRTSDAKLHSA
jgi:hypothetical protein